MKIETRPLHSGGWVGEMLGLSLASKLCICICVCIFVMYLWEVKIETRPLHSGGWVGGMLGLSLASKSNRALQKVALRNQNKNSFCNQ